MSTSTDMTSSSDQMDTDTPWKYTLLTEEEFNEMKNDPVQIVDKVEDLYSKKVKELVRERDEAKLEVEAYQSSSSSELNALEVRSVKIREERDNTLKRNVILEQNISNLDTVINELKEQLSDSKRIIDSKSREIEHLNNEKERLQDEKRNILNLVQHKDQEISTLNDDIQKLNDRVRMINRQKIEMEEKLNEANSSTLPLSYAIDKIKREKNLLEDQNKWLNDNLQKKSQELLDLHTNLTNELIQLRNKSDLANEEIRSLTISNSNLNTSLKTLSQKNDQYLLAIKEEKENSEKRESLFKIELEANKRLTEITETKIKETEKQLEEKNNEFALYRETAKKQLDRHLEDLRNYKNLNAQLSEEIETLKKDLNNSSTVKSSLAVKGVITSDIYSKFVSVSEENTKLKLELNKMKIEMDRINKEIEEVTPYYNNQKEEYERIHLIHTKLIKTHKELENKHKHVVEENNAIKRENKEIKIRIEVLERENEDMSNQVKLLLRECQNYKLKLNSPSSLQVENNNMEDDDDEDDNIEEYDQNRTINKSLDSISYKDIIELQNTNRKIVRELRESKIRHDLEIQELQTSSSGGHEDITKMFEERFNKLVFNHKREIEKYNVVIKERDFFKELSKERENRLKEMNQSTEILTPHVEDENKIKIIKEEFENERKDYRKNIKNLKSEVLKLESEINLRRNNEAFLTEKLKNLQTLFGDSHQQEIEQIKKSNADLIGLVIKWQTDCNNLENKLTLSREDINRMNITITHLKAEKNYFEKINEQLTKDCTELRSSRDQLDKFYNDLQSVQSSLDQRDKDQLRKLSNELELKTSESKNFNEKFENERILNQGLKVQLEILKNENLEKTQALEKNLTELRLEHEKEKIRVEGLVREREGLLNRISNLEKREVDNGQPRIFSSSSEGTNFDKERLEKEVEILTDAIGRQKENELMLSNNLKEMENSKNEIILEFNKFREMVTSEKSELENRIKNITTELESSSSKLDELKEEIRRKDLDVENLNSENENLKNQINSLKEEISSSRNQFHSNSEEVKKYKDEYEKQKKTYDDLFIKYGTELSNFRATEKLIQSTQLEIQQKSQQLKNHEATVNSLQSSFQERENSLNQIIEESKNKIRDLERSREILMSEVEILNVQIRKSTGVNSQATTASDERSTSDVDELRELTRILRREKEIVNSKLTVSEFESLRLKQQLDELKKRQELQFLEMENLRKTQNSVTVDQGVNEQLNLLRESNQSLRSNYETAIAQVDQWKNKCKTLENRIEPLEEQVRKLNGDLQIMEKDVARSQEEVTRWQDRANQLITKYKQIDPDEHEKILRENSELKQQIEQKISEVNQKNSELESRSSDLDKIVQLEKRITSLNSKGLHYKNLSQTQAKSLEETKAELDKIKAEAEKNKSEYDIISAKLEETKNDLEKQIQATQEISEARDKMKSLALTQVKVQKDSVAKLTTEKSELEQELNKLKADLTGKDEELSKVRAELTKVTEEVNKFRDQQQRSRNKRREQLEQQQKEKQQQEKEKQQQEQEKSPVVAPITVTPTPQPVVQQQISSPITPVLSAPTGSSISNLEEIRQRLRSQVKQQAAKEDVPVAVEPPPPITTATTTLPSPSSTSSIETLAQEDKPSFKRKRSEDEQQQEEKTDEQEEGDQSERTRKRPKRINRNLINIPTTAADEISEEKDGENSNNADTDAQIEEQEDNNIVDDDNEVEEDKEEQEKEESEKTEDEVVEGNE